jgi:hypothetical protein
MENCIEDGCEHWTINRVSDGIFNLNAKQTPNDYWVCGGCGMKFFDIIHSMAASIN